MSIQIKNAIIESATLSNADHGCLSSFIHVKYDPWSQGFGGFNLYSNATNHVNAGNYAGLWIDSVLRIAGVPEWKLLPDRAIRIKIDEQRQKIVAIGHIIKESWFNPKEEFEKLQNVYQNY